MSNEEHLEEILITAYKSGMYHQIFIDVDMELRNSKSKNFYEVIFDVFYKYVKLGKINY